MSIIAGCVPPLFQLALDRHRSLASCVRGIEPKFQAVAHGKTRISPRLSRVAGANDQRIKQNECCKKNPFRHSRVSQLTYRCGTGLAPELGPFEVTTFAPQKLISTPPPRLGSH